MKQMILEDIIVVLDCVELCLPTYNELLEYTKNENTLVDQIHFSLLVSCILDNIIFVGCTRLFRWLLLFCGGWHVGH
jgi:hypothetical protein